MALRSCALAVAVALSLAGCSDGPSPVTATRVLEVAGLRAVVNAVALTPGGSLVVGGDVEGVWTAGGVPAGAERWTVRVHSRGAVRSIDGVAFSPDGSLLATIGHGARTVELWEAATGRQAAVLSIGQSRGSAFHPTERVLVVAGGTTIHLVDLERGEVDQVNGRSPGDDEHALGRVERGPAALTDAQHRRLAAGRRLPQLDRPRAVSKIVARSEPSGENATPSMLRTAPRECTRTVQRSAPAGTSRASTSPSLSPTTTRLPSGLRAPSLATAP